LSSIALSKTGTKVVLFL